MSTHNQYFLSARYVTERNQPFALAVWFVLARIDGYFRKGDVMDHMTSLLRDGIVFGSQEQTEIGRWDKRIPWENDPTPPGISDDMYYAWVDPDCWSDYDPHLVFYSEAEFRELFADCCRNLVACDPERRDEYAAAMAANGLTL